MAGLTGHKALGRKADQSVLSSSLKVQPMGEEVGQGGAGGGGGGGFLPPLL